MLKLRPYQNECINSLFQYIKKNPMKNPLLVLPTGSGKSLIIAKICELIHKNKPHLNILVLAHRKELLEQNHDELKKIYPEAPAGLFCAGLNKSEVKTITIAMINSIFNKVDLLSKIDVIIIDEVHFVSNNDESMYQNLINDIREENPNATLIGLTATPFRMTGGNIYGKDKLFDDIAYNTDLMGLIKQGFLCPLRNKILEKDSIDLSNVAKSNGDYKKDELINACFLDGVIINSVNKIKEIAEQENRKAVLIFCSGVDHAEIIAWELEGVSLTGKNTAEERQQIISDFKAGKIKYLTNCDILTTGFNAPNIDMLVMLRPTLSTSLYVQMLGRGMRIHPNKTDCLVLDFAHNLKEHGSLLNLKVYCQKERKPEKHKICPMCEEIIKVSQMECFCGFIFETEHREFEPKHKDEFYQAIDVMTGEGSADWYEHTAFYLKVHEKLEKPPMLKLCIKVKKHGFWIYDYICLNHEGYAKKKAYSWLDKFFPNEEKTIENIMKVHKKMKIPKAVKAKMEGQWWRIKEYKF